MYITHAYTTYTQHFLHIYHASAGPRLSPFFFSISNFHKWVKNCRGATPSKMKQQHNEFYTFLNAGRKKNALRIHEKEIQAHPEPADVSEKAEKAFSFSNKE